MTELELRVDGPEGAIPARAFVKIVDQGLALLRDLDLAASQRGVPPARWLLTDLRKGSLVLVVRPEEQAERSDAELWRPARDLVHGVMTLEDEAVIPESFTSATLGRLVTLGRQVTRNNVEGISFETRNGDVVRPASLTPAVVVHAERATSVHDSSLGSAEGFLDVISIREKSTLACTTHKRDVPSTARIRRNFFRGCATHWGKRYALGACCVAMQSGSQCAWRSMTSKSFNRVEQCRSRS